MYSTTPQRRNNYDHPHSDLEVVPDSANFDKIAIPSSPYSHHDKILVPQQPYYQKEVVEQNAYGVVGGGYNNSPEVAAAAAGYGNGSEGQGAAAPIPPAGRREKILGLRRKTFFILVWVFSIALAIAIGVGAGVGASSSRNNNAAAAANGTTTGIREEITAAPGPAAPSQNSSGANTAGGPSTAPLLPTSLPATTTSPSSQSSSSTAPPPLKTGGVGGRCSNQWGADCVCLDSGICRAVWLGTPYIGHEGNWPCPADPANVMACVVKPCLGKAKGAQCLWREACRELSPGEF
jgi:hypothetical protein